LKKDKGGPKFGKILKSGFELMDGWMADRIIRYLASFERFWGF